MFLFHTPRPSRMNWIHRFPNLTLAADYEPFSSLNQFNQAVAKDPSYARAYTGLAEVYVLLLDRSIVPMMKPRPRSVVPHNGRLNSIPRSPSRMLHWQPLRRQIGTGRERKPNIVRRLA